MGTALNGFNTIARVYDFLARLVFGHELHTSQLVYLKKILPHANVLILGGGTGRILLPIFRASPTCSVYYVEASEVMIQLAKRRGDQTKNFTVHFIHGTQNDIPNDVQFDVVITNFFLDMFSTETATGVVDRLKSCLTEKGIWIATDFVKTTNWKHKMLLQVMYLFFHAFAGIEAKQLPKWEEQLKMNGLQEMESTLFVGGFVKTAWYRRKFVEPARLFLP